MSERALFVSQTKAAQAVQQLRSIMYAAKLAPHYTRGALVGYTAAYRDDAGWHTATEEDVLRYGL
jgi:hypothetical protein